MVVARGCACAPVVVSLCIMILKGFFSIINDNSEEVGHFALY